MARPTKGRLFQRGKGKAWCLQYYVAGRQIVLALRNDDGSRVANKEEAQAAADRELLPLRLQTVVARRAAVADALETAEQKAARADREAAAARQAAEESKAGAARLKETALANAWQVFMECPSRPRSCRNNPDDDMTTAACYRTHVRQMIDWLKKNNPEVTSLIEITPVMAARMMAAAAREAKPPTYNQKLGFYKLFFATLKKAGKVDALPFADIEPLPTEMNSRRPLTPEEVRRLLDNAPTREIRLLVAIAYFCGLRRGDCCTLQWREIDLDRGIIERLPRKIASRARDKAAARVKVGIPAYLYELLAGTPPAERVGFLLPEMAKHYETTRGRTVINEQIRAHFHRCGIAIYREGTGTPAVKDAAGRVAKPAVRAVVEVSFHSLRHSFVSHCAEAGVPLAIVQKAVGHAAGIMTEHYLKISDAAARRYAGALALPGPSDNEANREAAADRAKLRELADTAPAEAIRKAIEVLEGKL